jgi:hypothetical protein
MEFVVPSLVAALLVGCAAPARAPAAPVPPAEQPTYTPYPTYTPWPTHTPLPTYTALPTATPLPTYTPLPTCTPIVAAAADPTASPTPAVQPAAMPRAELLATATSDAALTGEQLAYPRPVPIEPGVGYFVFDGGGAVFAWTWERELAADEYYQVQLIGPGSERRGIHPPTKQNHVVTDRFLYRLVRDWYSLREAASSHWVVVVVRWDGVDPSKLGETLIESEPRHIKLERWVPPDLASR